VTRWFRPGLKLVLPVVVLGLGISGAVLLVATGPSLEQTPPEPTLPLVRVVAVERQSLRHRVRTHGTVAPRTESDLVPEVSGRVTWVSPALVSGGFFEEGAALLRIDPGDYRVALERARSQLARGESELHRARKELERQQTLAARKVASASRLDDAVNAEHVAAATLREARAALDQAERNLERTELTAPFEGRVRQESVDPGQFVSRGMAVARVYAVDWAEVRLPVPDDELAYLDLPLVYRGDAAETPGPEVSLRARFAGAVHHWTGRVVRTEGEIDPQTRMVHVVARIEDPYARSAGDDRPPLAVGLFVEAEIEGQRVEGVVVLPREAMRDETHVLVVDAEDRLHSRSVEVLRRGRDQVVIGSGLAAGERVCVSPIESVVEGMPVRVLATAAGAGAGA
jgi:RND family efflux transporter MFP subunit